MQLNPLRDNSELPAGSNSDQVFAIAMRATRGRIDKAFMVTRGNVKARLGKGESTRVNALNEAWVQTVEALQKGAYAAVVSRLHTSEAALSWIVVKETLDVGEVPTGNYTFEVSATEPVAPYLFAIKHLECFNDGIKVSFHADENRVGGVNQGNSMVTLRLLDKDDEKLAEYTGSLLPGDIDDNGNSKYLPDVIANRTDTLEVLVGATTEIAPTSSAYGYDGVTPKWASSDVLIYFTEGSTTYAVEDAQRAASQLEKTQYDYGYIASGGTKSAPLMDALLGLMHRVNRQFRFDVPGDLDPEAAVAWVEQMNVSGRDSAHLAHAFWAPLKCNDPTGINPRFHLGTATLNIAKACARNAQTNAKGFAPKNYPVAGRDWPVDRSGIIQTYTPDDPEMNLLARAKINPVIYSVYSGGGRYVWFDSLTCAPVDNSLRKLISVADMSSSIDDAVTRFAKDALQKPMKVAVKMTTDFLQTLFEGAEASDWIVPSADPEMGGAAFRFVVAPNEASPYDRMDVSYWLRYDGTNRQTFVTQTLSR
ncbi:hypothetical protein PU634_05130 [Oceanimonas pelagia]|uniref:Tail sheath protein n=1 Tax=Oceanimonas pelagia TaxID=3028314 RepID=A0AA50KR25_9GAMM|nr:hypothetical protein [Oceanimonas pelagia]WMC11751.1 hypothetical protein PU634_05130 [Oceanimonas pelagia]